MLHFKLPPRNRSEPLLAASWPRRTRFSETRGLSLQAFVVESEKCVSEKQAFTKRGTQFNNIAIEIEQSDVIVRH